MTNQQHDIELVNPRYSRIHSANCYAPLLQRAHSRPLSADVLSPSGAASTSRLQSGAAADLLQQLLSEADSKFIASHEQVAGASVSQSRAGGRCVNQSRAGGRCVSQSRAGDRCVSQSRAGGRCVSQSRAGGRCVDQSVTSRWQVRQSVTSR